jgi:hypothetical protein
MFKKMIFFVLAVLALSCLNTGRVKAQSELPPWKNLNCNYPQKYRGLEYCTGMDGKARVIVIDLTDPEIRLKYLIASGTDRYGSFGPCKDVNLPADWNKIGPGCYDPKNRNYYPVFSLFDAINKLPTAAVIIDSDYGAYTPTNRGHGPEGFTVIDGARIDGKLNGDTDNNAEKRPWLAFGYEPVIKVELDQLKPGSDDKPIPEWIYTAFGGAPWLVNNGTLMEDDIRSCKNANAHSCDKSAGQTAVGISLDRRWLYLVMMVDIENRNIDAMTIARFMKDQLVVEQAFKLDGGGSSQLYYGGLPEAERAYRVDGRWLSQYLGILAHSGTGIDLESTPLPSEPPSSGTDLTWWEKIQKEWTDFWGRVGNWWQELPQRIEDWLLQQFMDWLNQKLNQLCGSAGLIPITMAVVIYAHKRHRTKR